MALTKINSSPGKTYLARLKALCEVSGALPTPLMLSGALGDIGTEPVNSSGSANTYKAIYKECEVAVRTLKCRSKESMEGSYKVRMRRCVNFFGLLTDFPSGQSRRWLSGHGSSTKTYFRSLGFLLNHPGSLWSPNGCPMATSWVSSRVIPIETFTHL